MNEAMLLDSLLNELEAMIQMFGDLREDHLAQGGGMTAEAEERANNALWGVELALTHMHNAYRAEYDNTKKGGAK